MSVTPSTSATPFTSSERITFHNAATLGEVNRVAVLTLVLWITCAFIGALGFALPYARPLPPAPPPEPFVSEQLQVELTKDPLPQSDAAQPPPDDLTPPQPVAVAQPSPAIAFALPVEGPTRIVEASRAEYTRPSAT